MGIAASCAGCLCSALCTSYSCFKCCCTKSMGSGGLQPYQSKLFYVFFLGFGMLIGFLIALIGEDRAVDDGFINLGFFNEDLIRCEVIVNGDGVEETVCDGESVILRVSAASVIFFSIMLLGMIPVPTISGERNWAPLLGEGFHRGFWGIKLLIYTALVITFLVIGFLDETYTTIARFVSGIFLILQVLVLVDFAYIWNDTWVARSDVENDFADGSRGWLIALLTITGLLYIATYGGLIAILVIFSGCSATIGIAATTLVLCIACTVVAFFRDRIVDDEVSGSIAPPAVVSAYMAYLAFSASQSNPNIDQVECVVAGAELGESAGDIVLSLIFSIGTLVWTALTVSGSAESLLGGKVDMDNRPDLGGAYEISDGEGGTTYARDQAQGTIPGGNDSVDDEGSGDDKLWFFHFIMVTGSFHFAMVLTNYGISDLDARDGQDSNISMGVKAASGLAAGVLFIWTVIAPAVLPDREW